MAEFNWKGWGLIPLFCSKKEFKKIVSGDLWQHWAHDLKDEEIKERRRFYTRSCADLFRPIESGRFVTKLGHNSKPLFSFVQSFNNEYDEKIININQLELLALGEIYILYIHFDSPSIYTATEISKINRTVFQWEPRTEKHNVSQWTDKEGKRQNLKKHISTVLGFRLNQNRLYEEDTFGHELVNCTWIKQINGFNTGNTICVSELSAGIINQDQRYKLSVKERERLTDNQFDYWADWRCQLNLNRLVFIDQAQNESSLNWNLSKHQFYLDLFVSVISQRTSLNRFKDEMMSCSNKQRGSLHERISLYRRYYKIVHISTYPFADKLYQYFCQQADLSEIENKTFIELEYNYSLWKQEKEESTYMVLLFVSIVAALLVPASSIATIMALNYEQITSPHFLIISGLITFITILVMIFPLFKRFRKDRKLEKS
ncbi:hypothetical protein CF386_10045 [Paraphotobacterium marinum]|uniref:Uncharacterized protein n=1 Tax=Paraphotobacterium marinum TaxID=1755811 RepID=A0A220VGU4_9GAMM|nr:hypothetical protein [Paraphotobacterium marinum]ASK79392.1 hypothetical protein CF386_10045 [Paraphotobacterium marinum]